MEITTDKLTNEVQAEADGVLLKIVATEGSDVPVKGLLGYIGQPGEQVGTAAPVAPAVSAAPVVSAPEIHAVPAPIKEGKIRFLHLLVKWPNSWTSTIHLSGTGPGGRIIKRDILAAQEAGTVAAPAAPKVSEPKAPAVASSGTPFPVKHLELMEGDTLIKLTGMRRVVAQRMYASAMEIPAVTQTVKVDVTALLAFRKKLNEEGSTDFPSTITC